MARARNIKPSFFQHDVIGEIPPLARLLFIGLWTIADYRGCIEYRPKRIKTQVLPYDDGVQIEELVRSLDESGLIAIYTVQGTAYIKVLNFAKHQNPHKNEREAGSDLPDISHEDAQVVDFKGVEKNRDKNGTTPADSLLLNPSSLFPLPDSNLCDGASPPAQPVAKSAGKKVSAKAPSQSAATWEAYRAAYVGRYGAEPVRNATVNGQIAQFVSRIGAEESPLVAEFYVQHNEAFYKRGGHAVGLMLKDAEKLRMEWVTGRNVAPVHTAVTQPQRQLKSFAQQERETGWLRWEEMSGQEHPEMAKIRAQERGDFINASVIDITPQYQIGA